MTPGMQSLTLEADYKNLPPGKVAISEPDALVLGLKTGSLCTISDETGMQLGGAKSLLDLDVPPGHFFMEADTSKMMGIEPGFRYTLEPVPDPFTQPLEKLATFGFAAVRHMSFSPLRPAPGPLRQVRSHRAQSGNGFGDGRAADAAPTPLPTRRRRAGPARPVPCTCGRSGPRS